MENTGYARGQLARALVTAATHDDPATRERAAARVERWRTLIDQVEHGRVRIGSRTPVDGLPVWATPTVLHGGFATGGAAGGPLLPHEAALAESAGVPASREALFAHLLSEAGQAWLGTLLDTHRYDADLPEETALLVVTWLARAGRYDTALTLAEEISSWVGQLRFTPVPVEEPPHEPDLAPDVADTVLWRRTAGEARADLERRRPNERVEAMRETLTVWNPFADELLQLWLDSADAHGVPGVHLDAAWRGRAEALLARYRTLAATHTRSGKHRRPKENLAVLRSAVEEIVGAGALSPRTRGLLRHVVASMVRRRGAPGSDTHRAVRAAQAANAAVPSYAEVARVVAGRLAGLPAGAGVADVADVTVGAPDPVVRVVRRAWAAPLRDLVQRGVVPSGEVLAALLPPVTAGVIAGGYADPALRALMAATYRAFRNRRSLLLLNLEHQVRVGELPWVRAVDGCREPGDGRERARSAVASLGALALGAFPGSLLPNPLVRELGVLTRDAGDEVPWVEELAADIFMGEFSSKFPHAARLAGGLLRGSLYERYYGIDYGGLPFHAAPGRYGVSTSPAFNRLCADRAGTGRRARRASPVAANGTVIEQAQILTTHNLATLVATFGVRPGADWADRAFAEVVRRAARVARAPYALAEIKNAAFAWRAMIFYASVTSDDGVAGRSRAALADTPEPVRRLLRPAVAGLTHIADGGVFAPDGTALNGGGRRLLGWTAGPHWMRELAASRRTP